MIFKAAENLPYFQKLGHLIVIIIIIVPDLELNMMKLVIFPWKCSEILSLRVGIQNLQTSFFFYM